MKPKRDCLKYLEALENYRKANAEKPRYETLDYVIRVCQSLVAEIDGYEHRADWIRDLSKTN